MCISYTAVYAAQQTTNRTAWILAGSTAGTVGAVGILFATPVAKKVIWLGKTMNNWSNQQGSNNSNKKLGGKALAYTLIAIGVITMIGGAVAATGGTVIGVGVLGSYIGAVITGGSMLGTVLGLFSGGCLGAIIGTASMISTGFNLEDELKNI